ncbi:MAG: hypothetical protein WBW33_31345 [Bryobacteraceae bacterium]
MDPNEHIEPDVPIPDEIQVETGYDKQEPRAGLIAGLTLATVIALIAVIMGVRAYFDYTKQQYEEKVGASVAEDLKNLHSNEDEALNSYKVVDKAQGVVRIPIRRAMELIAKESAEGKLKYEQKSYPVKNPNAGSGPPGDATGKPVPAAANPAKATNGSNSNSPAGN